MGFLSLIKKRDESLDVDLANLDLPPEPPKIGAEWDKGNEAIDEELMPPIIKKNEAKYKKPKKEEIELPPLPKLEELDQGIGPEFPTLPPEEELSQEEDIEPQSLPEFGELPKEEELDIPPPPMPMRQEKKPFFGFLKPKKGKAITIPVGELPPLDEIQEFGKDEEQELPAFPEIEEEFKPLPELEEETPFAPRIEPLQQIQPMTRKPSIKEEIRAEKIEGQLSKFIRVDDFRNILNYIYEIRSYLKDDNLIFTKLEEIEAAKNKRYEELHNNLVDIQRKMLFVDKTLFKG